MPGRHGAKDDHVCHRSRCSLGEQALEGVCSGLVWMEGLALPEDSVSGDSVSGDSASMEPLASVGSV
jgi:hypothetical protein